MDSGSHEWTLVKATQAQRACSSPCRKGVVSVLLVDTVKAVSWDVVTIEIPPRKAWLWHCTFSVCKAIHFMSQKINKRKKTVGSNV